MHSPYSRLKEYCTLKSIALYYWVKTVSNVKNKYGLQGVRRFLLIQLCALALLILAAAAYKGSVGALSALLGGLVNIIPSVYFAMKLFQYHGARAARKILKGFYQGEALKICLSAILFALVFIVFNVIPWVFFAAYISLQLLMWFAPLIFKR